MRSRIEVGLDKVTGFPYRIDTDGKELTGLAVIDGEGALRRILQNVAHIKPSSLFPTPRG